MPFAVGAHTRGYRKLQQIQTVRTCLLPLSLFLFDENDDEEDHNDQYGNACDAADDDSGDDFTIKSAARCRCVVAASRRHCNTRTN